jgi:hypothetical protein
MPVKQDPTNGLKPRSRKLRRENLALEARWKMQGFTLEEIAEKITAHNGNQCLPVTINAVKLDMGDCKSIWLQTVAWSQNEMRVSAVQELRRVRREACPTRTRAIASATST